MIGGLKGEEGAQIGCSLFQQVEISGTFFGWLRHTKFLFLQSLHRDIIGFNLIW